MSKFGKMSYIDETLVKYRQHIDNEVGSKRKTDSINNFEEMRNLFIDVKLDHFKTFKKNKNVFDDKKFDNLSELSYEYYNKLQNIKKVRFKETRLFLKLYKYEKFGYAMQNYLILNMPFLAKPLFKLKKKFSK